MAEVRPRPKGGGGEGEEGRICSEGVVDIVDHLGILLMLYYLHVLCTIDYEQYRRFQGAARRQWAASSQQHGRDGCGRGRPQARQGRVSR